MRRYLRPVVLACAFALPVLLAYQLGWLERAELWTLDTRFRLRGPVDPKASIVIISIDQDSFDELNLPWPWPRDLHAELVRKLATAGARIIGIDILFTEPKADPREDRSLAEAIRVAGNVILAAEYTEVQSAFGPKSTLNPPIPLIRDHALGYGPVNLFMDLDGVVRRADSALSFQGQTYPSFAYLIYARYRGKTFSETDLPTEPHLINFRGPARTYPLVPYYRVLRDEIDLSFLRDKIILVGSYAESLQDNFATPFGAVRRTAGVEIQANLIETLLAADSIRRVGTVTHSLIFLLLCALASWISYFAKPLKALTLIMVLAAGYLCAAFYLLSSQQLWLPLIPSLSGMALGYGASTLDNYMRERKERLHIREMFSRYVSAQVVEELLEDREGLALGGQRRHLTVLFSDIRDFTSLSEQTDPELVVSLLSDYLAQVTYIVFKHKGTIDKFIGDAVFVIFGAPKSYGNDALRAVQAGIEMIQLAESLSPKWVEKIGRPLKIGVGINTGEAVVGAIGSEIRSDFTAIGDTVNLGSRLEGLTKELGVPMLVSEFTVAEIKGAVPLKPLRQVKVSGRETSILVYCPEILLKGETRI